MSTSRLIKRKGAATVEFALVVPFLLLLLVGVFEFGRAIMVQQILTNAAREGARRAVVEGATAAEVETLVVSYLDSTSVTGASVTCTPSTLSTAGFGDPVMVNVSVPFDNVTWMSPWFLGGRTLTATTHMHADRLQ